jgi:hypothetical protein
MSAWLLERWRPCSHSASLGNRAHIEAVESACMDRLQYGLFAGLRIAICLLEQAKITVRQ